MWFKDLTGFQEDYPENVKSKLIVENDYFISLANSKKFTFGKLEIPTLEELRNQTLKLITTMVKFV